MQKIHVDTLSHHTQPLFPNVSQGVRDFMFQRDGSPVYVVDREKGEILKATEISWSEYLSRKLEPVSLRCHLSLVPLGRWFEAGFTKQILTELMVE